MTQLLEESQSKSQQVRSKVSQYLVQILPELNQQQLERYLPQLDSTISKNVSDANPEVRYNFRFVFGIYYQLFPQKAERIYGNADTSIKKLLQEEMTNQSDISNNNNNNNQNTNNTSNNRLLQHKSLDIGTISNTSHNSVNAQKLQSSTSMGVPNDDSHFHFASSNQNNLTVSSLQAPPPRALNKTPTHQQKANNILSNDKTTTINVSTSNNNLRNGPINYSQDRTIGNNLKQVSDQMTLQSNKEKPQNGSRISPLRGGNRNDTVSPLKGNISTLQSRQLAGTEIIKAPSSQSTKNMSQGTSYASTNFNIPTSTEQSNYTADQQKHKKQQGSIVNTSTQIGNQSTSSQVVGNLRYNNHQTTSESKLPSSSSSNISSKIQQTEGVDALNFSNNQKKINAYRSQDQKKNSIDNQMQGSRVNSSLTRPPTQGAFKKPIYQKRNSLTEENQNSQDSGLEYDQSENVKNKNIQQNSSKQITNYQNGNIGLLNAQKNNFQKQGVKQKHQYRDEDEDNEGLNDIDDDDYEPYNRRSHHTEEQDKEQQHYEQDYQEGEEEEDDDDDEQQNIYQNGDDFEDYEDLSKQNKNNQYKSHINVNNDNKNNNDYKITNSNINKNNNNNNSQNNNYNNKNVKQNKNLSDFEDNNQNRSKKNIKNNIQHNDDDYDNEDEDIIRKLAPKSYDNQFQLQSQNNQKTVPIEPGKRIVKSAMNSLKNSDSKNAAKQQSYQNSVGISLSKSSAVSPTGYLLNGNVSVKHNNFMTASHEAEDRYLRQSPPVDEQQQNKYSNNFKTKKQIAKSTNALPKAQSTVSNGGFKNEQEPNSAAQQQYSWRDDDLELLLDKINNNANWSTRVSAFESLKEVIGELNSQNSQAQSYKQNEVERINSGLIKRIINAHIEHLSDSHFKVVSVCLDSLISLVSYDSSFILPKLDQLIFKVLNNLIDTKDVVSSKANFLVNILSKVFQGEKLIEPIQKVLEQTNKNLLKICSLEVLMVTVKNAEEYYQTISNVRHTVQLMCMIIQENQTQKQMALPCLGIILALRDHNQQGTLHSILSLTNQNQITALRNLSYEYAQDLEEDLRRYVQKENIKPNDKIAKSNMKQFQIDQTNPSNTSIPSSSTMMNPTVQQQQQMGQVAQTSTTNINKTTQNGGMYKSSTNNLNNLQMQKSSVQSSMQNMGMQNAGIQMNQMQKSKVAPSGKTSNSSPEKNYYPTQNFDIKRIEEIYSCVSDFEQNEQFVIQYVNEILLNTIDFFKSPNRKIKEQSLKILQFLFMRNYFFLTIQPHTVIECLSIYPHIPKDMDFYQIDEVIDEMVDCVPHLIFMKALVEKLNSEKPPQLQIMIKKISCILRKARKEEIRPFLDHLIDSFKMSINDASPDVRKSVVFCLVDLKFLMQEEVDPYLHQFTGNQQKLVDIYIKKRVSNDGNGVQD